MLYNIIYKKEKIKEDLHEVLSLILLNLFDLLNDLSGCTVVFLHFIHPVITE